MSDGDPSAVNSTLTATVPEATFTAVEYPGYVRNAPKELQSLGGEAAIPVSGQAGQDALRLVLRPDAQYAHALYGQTQSTKALLLRVSRPRAGTGASGPCTARIEGIVTTVCQFSSLADYQYLPSEPTNTLPERDYLRCPPENQPIRAEPTEVAQPLMCVPPLFSKLVEPVDYAWRQGRVAGMCVRATARALCIIYLASLTAYPQQSAPHKTA